MKTYTRRDLTIISGVGWSQATPTPATDLCSLGDKCLVIACDSCGAVGAKKEDVLKLSTHYVAKFTLRVALSEVMCSGAKPVTIINGVACEMKPTGEELILGIREELENANISDIVLTGSTEENFTTNMTALAITVIGVATEDELKFGQAAKGDKLVLLGSPSVGEEVDLESKGFYTEIRQLLLLSGVKEIVPVGSKGIAYEAEMLESMNSMVYRQFDYDSNDSMLIDFNKSAGPATCLLVLCAESSVNHVMDIYPKGLVVGEYVTNA